MREAPRNFAPGNRALRGNDFGDIIEHDNIADAVRDRQMRAARKHGQCVVGIDIKKAAVRHRLGMAFDFNLLLPVQMLGAIGGRLRTLL